MDGVTRMVLLDDLVMTSIRIIPVRGSSVRGVYYNIGMSLAVIVEGHV